MARSAGREGSLALRLFYEWTGDCDTKTTLSGTRLQDEAGVDFLVINVLGFGLLRRLNWTKRATVLGNTTDKFNGAKFRYGSQLCHVRHDCTKPLSGRGSPWG